MRQIHCFISAFFLLLVAEGQETVPISFPVGVVLDLGTLVGKMAMTGISLAIEDFYAHHSDYSTRLILHTRDSKADSLEAASQVLDLIRNAQVQGIIGPQSSAQVPFVSEIGNKTHVPIISFSATSPCFSSVETPYFIRTMTNDSAQVNAISAIVEAFGWRRVVPIYEDTAYGRDVMPYFADALHEVGSDMPYRSVISLSASDDQIREELLKLMTMPTRVFIVHMSPPMGIRLFSVASEVGMMSEGYVWIVTDGITNILESLENTDIDKMQGVLGVKAYVPNSANQRNFNTRWKRKFWLDNPIAHPAEPSNFVWKAYDTVWALAMAAEKVGGRNSGFQSQQTTSGSSMNLTALGVSANGGKLLEAIGESSFKGLAGEFQLVDGQLENSAFQIVNVVGKGTRNLGFWTPDHGFSKQINSSTKLYSTLISDLKQVIWPGEPTSAPKGWVLPVSGKKLRVGVPLHAEKGFVDITTDPVTNVTTVTGYCIDIFKAVVDKMPYPLLYEFIPCDNRQTTGTYNTLVYQVYNRTFDAVVGDVTIRASRAKYVDFTLPYTDSGVSMLVPVKETAEQNAWTFTKPLTRGLWVTSFCFFIFTGFVVWALEHRHNPAFQGPVHDQIGATFCFAFLSNWNVKSNFSRIVVVVWLFVALILQTNYTASLASMLTVQQLQPTITDVQDLIRNGNYVGYHRGSFVADLLTGEELHFPQSKLKPLPFTDYFEALSNGTVSAIVEENVYIRLFLAKHPKGFTMIGPLYKTAGFGFVFTKGSPLVPDFSNAILEVTEENISTEIEKKWLGVQLDGNSEDGNSISSNRLNFESFKGLFLATAVVSLSSLLLYTCLFFIMNRADLDAMAADQPILVKLKIWFKYFFTARPRKNKARRRMEMVVFPLPNEPAQVLRLREAEEVLEERNGGVGT